MARSISSKIEDDLGLRRIQRVRWKRFAWLGGIALFAALAYFPINYLIQRTVRDSALAQAELALKNKEIDLALRHLDHYLASHPEDIPALELKSKILADVYLPWTQLIEAAKTLDLLIRLDPKGAARLETRRNLADFYIRYSEELKRFAEKGSESDIERKESRFGAAAAVATQLVQDAEKGNYKDPVAHRLLARASEGQISDLRKRAPKFKDVGIGDRKDNEVEDLRLRTIKNYQIAIDLDPHDIQSSTRLANLFLSWSNDPAASDSVLDAMLAANPKSVEARLARYRAFSTSNREKQANAELDAILAIAPENVEVRLQIASVALGRRNSKDAMVEARRQLDAIPADRQDDLRVKILRGYIEFAEQHPDEAIDQWRRGLMLVGGTNQDLTWRLAFNLIQLGRYLEADPLRQQYLRLAKGDKNGLGKFLDALFDMNYGRLYESRRKLDKIKDVVPPGYKTDVLIALGRCCDMIGDADGALLAYRSAAITSPDSAGPRLAIARHLQRRSPEEAIREVARALQESPTESHLLLESIRLRLENPAFRSQFNPERAREIEDLLTRAQAVAPTNPSLLIYRADYLALSGQFLKSVELLSQAVKGEYRTIPEIWMSLAQGLDRLNQRNEAIQVLDQASLPENVGDRVMLRIAKARLLARAGKGQAAREALSKDRERLSISDRPELARALGELLRELGDRDGALEAYSEWAQLAPSIPGPALALLTMAQLENDDRAAKLGLEALKKIGGDREPYGIAARVLELLRKDPTRPGPLAAERLYEAELLVKTLQQEVPSLRFGNLLQGMIQEQKGNLEAAVKSYFTAQKDDINSPALPKLIEAYIKLKRIDELDRLRQDFVREAETRQQPGLATEFDRMSAAAALKLGDRDRADYYASRMMEGRRNNIAAQAAIAWMLDPKHDADQAEETLRGWIKEKPQEATNWLSLIIFQAARRTSADVARTIGQARREYNGERTELFLAQCYWLGKDLTNAKAAFKKALEAKPDDLLTLRRAVEYYDSTNQGDLIDPTLRKILKIDPANNWAARTLAMRITIRPDPVAWQEAWSLVGPESPAAGETPEDRLVRATVLARSTDVSRRREAIPAFASLANDLPVYSPLAIDTRLRLSQAMLDINQFGEAWTTIRPVADDLARPNASALVLAIESLSRSNRPGEAEIRLERLVAIDPKSPQVRLSRSWIQMARGKKDEAIASLMAAYNESADSPNAEVVARLAVDRMIKFGDVETSLQLAKIIAGRWPVDAGVVAKVHCLRNEFDQALAATEAAIDGGAQGDTIRFAMLAATARRSDSEFVRKASKLAEKAKSKSPKDPNVRVYLATILHLQDRYKEELECYREAIELAPTNVQFLNNMAWTLCEGLHQPEEGMKYIQEAIRREGEAPQYLDTRGVIEERLGHFDRAISDLEKSVKFDPAPTTYFHLARAYWKAKDAASCRRCRDLAIKGNFDPKSLDPTDRTDLAEVMGMP